MSKEDLPPTEEWHPDEEETIQTEFLPENVSKNTQIFCERCGGKSYLRDGKCPVCDHGLVL